MRHTVNIYRRLLGVQLRSQMQYRTAFVLDTLASATIVLLEFGAIALVLDRFGHIQGWTLGEVAFLYALVEISFGLMDMVFSGFDPPRFGRMVRQGSFDQLLLRPVNITVQVLGSDVTIRRMGKIILGSAIFLLALQMTDITWTAVKVAYLPIVILSMFLFFSGLFMIGSTITFWTVESIEIMNILTYGGSFMMSYPMHIYPLGMRRVFTFVIPAIFLNYYPALFFLDKPDPFNFPSFAPFIAPFVGGATFVCALIVWHFGMRHYQSTGT